MRIMTLDRLVLTNFRGVRRQELSFHSTECTIVGPNGKGKSTFMEAWYWLWTGYDMKRQNNFAIKPVDENGKSEDRIMVSVEAFITYEGYPVALRKELHEKWGPISDDDPTEEFKKNEFEFFIDGVNTKTKKAFQEKLDSMIRPEDVEVLANPHYFLMMEQASQRKVIMDLVGGDVSDEDLVKSKPEYAKLVEVLKRKPLAEYQKEISNNISASNDQKKNIPVLIEENQNKVAEMPTEADFEEISQNLEAKKAELLKLEEEIAKSPKDKKQELREQKQKMLEGLKADLERHKSTFKNNQDLANEEIKNKRIPLEGEQKRNETQISELRKTIALNENRIISIENVRSELRAAWHKVNDKTFEAPADPHSDEQLPSCELCDRVFTAKDLADNRVKLEKQFNEKKAEDKKNINDSGVAKKKEMEEISALVTKDKAEVEKLELRNNELALELESAELQTKDKKVEDTDEFKQLSTAILERETELKKLGTENGDDDQPAEDSLPVRKERLVEAIEVLNQSLGQKILLESTNKRIEELKEDEKKVNTSLLNWKKADSVVKQYQKDKSAILEEKVNKKFKLVKFQMFEFLNDGSSKLACNPTVDGVNYKVVNTAKLTAAQVDVANTFVEKTGLCFPVFLDNQESVGNRPATPCQVINIEFPKHDKLTEIEVIV